MSVCMTNLSLKLGTNQRLKLVCRFNDAIDTKRKKKEKRKEKIPLLFYAH